MNDSEELDGLVERLKELRLFLNGEGELDGHSFGETALITRTRAGAFWWRKHLARMDLAASTSLRLREERDELLRDVQHYHQDSGLIPQWRADRVLARAQSAEALLARCVKAADSGQYRDRSELTIAAHPAFEDARNALAALAQSQGTTPDQQGDDK